MGFMARRIAALVLVVSCGLGTAREHDDVISGTTAEFGSSSAYEPDARVLANDAFRSSSADEPDPRELTGNELDVDFESGFGAFSTEGVTWERGSGYTPTGNGKTGPDSGNGGSGYYAFAEANGNEFVDVHLDMDLPSAFPGSGVAFYYYMFGNQIGDLTFSVSDDGVRCVFSVSS